MGSQRVGYDWETQQQQPNHRGHCSYASSPWSSVLIMQSKQQLLDRFLFYFTHEFSKPHGCDLVLQPSVQVALFTPQVVYFEKNSSSCWGTYTYWELNLGQSSWRNSCGWRSRWVSSKSCYSTKQCVSGSEISERKPQLARREGDIGCRGWAGEKDWKGKLNRALLLGAREWEEGSREGIVIFTVLLSGIQMGLKHSVGEDTVNFFIFLFGDPSLRQGDSNWV